LKNELSSNFLNPLPNVWQYIELYKCLFYDVVVPEGHDHKNHKNSSSSSRRRKRQQPQKKKWGRVEEMDKEVKQMLQLGILCEKEERPTTDDW
jgi:hypothetical protein